jgi:rhodanese-related sulfurtransferase
LSSYTSISVETLARAVGTGQAPVLVDVRAEDAFVADPRLVPGSIRRDAGRVELWGQDLAGRRVVCICRQGDGLSQGAAAWLRNNGNDAEHLAGGFGAWRDANQPLTRTGPIPQRNNEGQTVWVTRERPKIDRIACPWLIRRFVDPNAVFLFVAPAEVPAVAESFAATPFDIEGAFWSHRGETCTFDTMLTEFGLQSTALDRLAVIVRGADTARPDLAPQAPGLLAISLGLSQLIHDDLEQLEAGLLIYDALYLWCRDASEETHNWPSKSVGDTQ